MSTRDPITVFAYSYWRNALWRQHARPRAPRLCRGRHQQYGEGTRCQEDCSERPAQHRPVRRPPASVPPLPPHRRPPSSQRRRRRPYLWRRSSQLKRSTTGLARCSKKAISRKSGGRCAFARPKPSGRSRSRPMRAPADECSRADSSIRHESSSSRPRTGHPYAAAPVCLSAWPRLLR